MKKILLCVFILLLSVNVFAADVDIEQLTEAANSGDAEAQFLLGDSYYFGNGVKKDYKQAVYWYIKASEQGYADAQSMLGFCYVEGRGVAQNYIEAFTWYALAAEQNNIFGYYGLGYCYHNGYGVLKNNILAYMWYSLGLPNTSTIISKIYIERWLTELELEMTPAEIAEAEQMAVEWMEKHR